MHTGTAPQSRLEKVWLALSAALGITLLEAAQLAHGVQQGWAWLRWALRAAATAPGRARRALVGATVQAWGWELRDSLCGRWSARRLDGMGTLTCDGLRDFIEHAWRQRLQLEELVGRLQVALTAQNRLHRRLEETERFLERAQEANMENGRRALELEARLGRVGAQLEAMAGELEEAHADLRAAERIPCPVDGLPCGDCGNCVRETLAQRDESQAELGNQRVLVAALRVRSAAWKELFLKALTLATQEHARALHWRFAYGRELIEVSVNRAEVKWLREAYWERDVEFEAASCRELRNRRRLLRAERREARELSRACRYALEALSDPDTAWTPSGTDIRQELRRVLGKRRAPECSICGVDWCRPETCPRVGSVVLRGIKL